MSRRNKEKILIIGGGRRGLAVIEVLSGSRMDIMAVVDINPKASGIKLARRLGIETSKDWKKYFKGKSVPGLVLNLTGDAKIQEELDEISAETGVEAAGLLTNRVLGSLLVERQVQTEMHRVSRKMATDISLEELVILILSSCVKGTKASGGLLILFNEDTGSWDIRSNWGIDGPARKTLIEEAEKKLPLWLEKDEALPLTEDSLCAPLRFRGKVTGAIITVFTGKERDLLESSRRLLSIFASQSAVAIQNVLLYKKSQELSVTDGLTGVFNHRYFQEQMETELNRAQRYDHSFSLLIIDLDNFKDINDNYGHLKGDMVLRKIAAAIGDTVRDSDIVARYGGDEFVILLPETDKKGAVAVSGRIREAIAGINFEIAEKVNISVGVSAYPDDGVCSGGLVAKADNALYTAKDQGRNRTCTA